MPLGESPGRVPEKHALHEAVDDDTASDHCRILAEMDLREILRQRRMVRAYEPEPIPRQTIERIVGTVRRAPSAGFSQGQRLVVVTDADTRQRIADLLEEASPAPRPGATLEPWLKAPVLIVVGVREDDYHDRYRKPDKLSNGVEIEWPIPYWHFDAGAAAMLILLAAIDEGLRRRALRCVHGSNQVLQGTAAHTRRRRRRLLHHRRQTCGRFAVERDLEQDDAGQEERGRSRPLGALGLGRPDLRDQLLLVVAGVLARGVERLDRCGVGEPAA